MDEALFKDHCHQYETSIQLQGQIIIGNVLSKAMLIINVLKVLSVRIQIIISIYSVLKSTYEMPKM